MTSMWTIRRSATDGKLTGLCAGVARYWGIDPTLVRVGVALLALSGGIGLVLYVAGWLLVPIDGRTTSALDDLLGPQARRWSKEVWLAIVVIACVISFAILGALTPFGVGPAVILAGIWYFGYYKNRKPGQTYASSALPPPDPAPEYEFVSYAGPATPFTEAAEAWRRRIEEYAGQEAAQRASRPVGDQSATDVWPVPPRANVEPPGPIGSEMGAADIEQEHRQAFLAEPDPVGLYSPATEAARAPVLIQRADAATAKRLRLVSLIVLGMTLTGLGVASYLGVVVPVATYFSAALLVVGLTLLAATWFGRARGLLPLALVLLIGMLATSLPTGIARDDWARTQHTYTQVTEFPVAGDSRDMGQVTTDLSKLKLTADATYTSHVDFGSLTVIVPPDAQVRVDYSVDSGAVEVFDRMVAGGTELHDVLPPGTAQVGSPTLTLDLSVDHGRVVVRR